MATKVSQRILDLMATKTIDFANDTFHIILMNTGFTWNRGTQKKLSDVTASQLATGSGYTQDTKALASVSVTQDDSLFKLTVTWANVSWVASGGSIGPAAGAFIYDDTHADDPLVEYIDFGGDKTEPDGGTFTIPTPTFEITT